MSQLTYTPDEDIKVHEEGAIRLICRAYQSHEDGLPEWLKNSADVYAREDAPEAKRIIVVIFDYGRRDVSPSISCLDFSGMTSTVIEEDFRIWADPEAARRGGRTATVQGGHGNGGKCYMTQMFEDYSLIHTVKREKGSRYGVEEGSIRFGYIPDRQTGRNFAVADLKSELDRALKAIRCSTRIFPEAIVEALRLADGFTLVTGVGPKGYSNRIPHRQLIENLQEHPQMIQTLELCKVYVVLNGEVLNQGKALTLPEIKPMAGGENPRVIPIPPVLKDPVNENEVSTDKGGSLPPGTLALFTSDVSMRYSKKGRHNVTFWKRSDFLGYVPVPELDIQSAYRDRIYGECRVESLEPFKQNERARLARSPLTRAVEQFISKQIELYAREFEARDRRRYDQQEKDALSKINDALDRWKNRLLTDLMRGLWGPGDKGSQPQPRLPTGTPAKLELTLTHPRAGLGIAFRPTLKFFDSTGRQIRAAPFTWLSNDTNVAMVDQDLMIINTFSYGQTTIYAETLDHKIRSNQAPLEVVRIVEIDITPSELQVSTGSRHKLEANCRLASGEIISDIYLEWTENNPNVARVSSSGLVFGFSPGQTEVTTGDDKCLAKKASVVTVVPGGTQGKGNQPGKGFPVVRISEVQTDPETGETVTFSREDPPVCQRPQDVDRNIWWINSGAPFARLYLDTGRGYGYLSREWRIYHLERYTDIMVQIALTHGPAEKQAVSVGDWILEWGAQAARIQEIAVASLNEFINTGQLPED